MEIEERTAKCHDHKENFLYRRHRKKQAKKVIFGLAFLARMKKKKKNPYNATLLETPLSLISTVFSCLQGKGMFTIKIQFSPWCAKSPGFIMVRFLLLSSLFISIYLSPILRLQALFVLYMCTTRKKVHRLRFLHIIIMDVITFLDMRIWWNELCISVSRHKILRKMQISIS